MINYIQVFINIIKYNVMARKVISLLNDNQDFWYNYLKWNTEDSLGIPVTLAMYYLSKRRAKGKVIVKYK